MYDFLTVGSATQDVFVKSDLSKILTTKDIMTEKSLLCFDYGSKINVNNITFTTGGGATNTAVSLARQGFKVASLFATGDDSPSNAIIDELEKEGVDTSLTCKLKDHNTGYSVVLNSFEGDRTVLCYRGANNFLLPKLFDWEKVKSTKWIHITSLSGSSSFMLPKISDIIKENNIAISFNPGSAQIKVGLEGMADILKLTKVLFLNKDEAAQLTGIQATKTYIDNSTCTLCETCIKVCPTQVFARVGDEINVVAAEKCTRCSLCVEQCPTRAVLIEPWAFNTDLILKKLKSYGPEIVVVTDGRRGVQVYDGQTRYVFPTYDVPVIDTLGAGDSFASTFIGGLLRYDGDVKKSIMLASANAASVVQKFGGKAGLLSYEELEEYVKNSDFEEELDIYDIGG